MTGVISIIDRGYKIVAVDRCDTTTWIIAERNGGPGEPFRCLKHIFQDEAPDYEFLVRCSNEDVPYSDVEISYEDIEPILEGWKARHARYASLWDWTGNLAHRARQMSCRHILDGWHARWLQHRGSELGELVKNMEQANIAW